MKLRLETPIDYSAPKQWVWLNFRLIYWPMWKNISVWDFSEWRISFKHKFFIFGPFEIRGK